MPLGSHQRVLEQSVRTGAFGAVTGWASLHWQGASYLDGSGRGEPLPVLLVMGHLGDLRPHPGSSVTRERLNPREVVEVDGVRCTVPARAVFDEVRRTPGWRTGVVVAAMAVAAGLVTPDELASDTAVRTGWTGVERARTAARLVRAGRASPPEAMLGLAWEVDADLPQPLYNPPVFSLAGDLLGIPDLLDPVAGLVVEYDGADHRLLDRRRADVTRSGRFRDHGLEVATLVTGDLGEPDLVVGRLLAARRRSPFTAPADRRWTLDPPAWWVRRQQRRNLAG